jgi:hypothetical protein
MLLWLSIINRPISQFKSLSVRLEKKKGYEIKRKKKKREEKKEGIRKWKTRMRWNT